MTDATVPRREDPGKPDGLFALIGGVYAAAICGPLTMAVASRVPTGTGGVYVASLVVAVVATVVGAVAVRRQPGIAERLGRAPLAWALVAGPLVPVAAFFAVEVTAVVDPTDVDILAAGLGGSGAAFVGFVLVSMAKTRYAAWVLDGGSVDVTWSAPWPAETRRRVWYVAGAALSLGGVAFVVGALLEQDALRILGQVLVPAGAVLGTVGRTVTYRATDRGLEIRVAVARRVRPWSAFAGYRLSGDALVLVRRSPYRQSIRCDATAIDEPKAVAAALDRSLERLS